MDEEWDVVTLQQASGYSGSPHTYARKDEIISYLFANMKNKNAKIYWHMTWAYEDEIKPVIDKIRKAVICANI